MTEIGLNQIQLDALREISSIAAGNAATSLSALLGKKVDITVPNIMVEAVGQVPQALGGAENIANVVYFAVEGEVSGSVLMVISTSQSPRLVSVLTGQKVTETESLDELGLSALKELGNITVGAYLSAMHQGLKMRITHSIPGFASDMMGAILDGILARISLKAGEAIIIDNELAIEEGRYRTHLIFIPDPKSVKGLLGALGV